MSLGYWMKEGATKEKFIEELPMTTTGKIRRVELRKREIEKKGKKDG